MLISILGDIRVGKTLVASTFAANSIRKHVYANYWLDLENYNLLEPEDLYKLKNNSDVFIDEAYAWLEARNSGDDLNKCSSYILFQSGKRDIDIFLTAQLFSSVDIRFRKMSNVLIECSKYEKEQVFEYIFYERIKGQFYYCNTWYFPFYEAKKYYDIYDTLEIVEPIRIKQMETRSILRDSKRAYAKSKEIAEIIKPDLNKFTHDAIKLALLDNEIDLQYEKFVYLILNNHVKNKIVKIIEEN